MTLFLDISHIARFYIIIVCYISYLLRVMFLYVSSALCVEWVSRPRKFKGGICCGGHLTCDVINMGGRNLFFC